MIRRFTSILLLMLLLLSAVGVQTSFIIQKRQVRSAMKKRIKNGVPKDELFTFRFKSSDIPQWTRPEKEFKVDEHLYDVVDVYEDTEGITYMCVSDDQETFLFADLGKHVSKSLGDENTPTGKVIGVSLGMVAISEIFHITPILFYDKYSNDNFEYSFSVNTCDLQGEGRPPEFS